MPLPVLPLALVAAASYSVAAWNARLQQDRRLLLLQLLGLATHALALVGSLQIADGRLGLSQALSLVTWQTALLLTLLWKVPTLWPLRSAIYPLAAAGALLAAIWPSHAGAEAPQDWKIALHVALSIFAAGLLTLAAAQSVALAVLDRLLHRPDQLTRALRMPPMQAAEDWLFQLIAAGFFVLSMALLSGLVFVDDLFAQHLAHKTVLSILAWAIFGGLLLGRRRWGWRGRQAVRWVLSGYLAFVLAYFGSKLVLEHVLGRHWS